MAETKQATKVLVLLGSPRRKGNSALEAGAITANQPLMEAAEALGKKLIAV